MPIPGSPRMSARIDNIAEPYLSGLDNTEWTGGMFGHLALPKARVESEWMFGFDPSGHPYLESMQSYARRMEDIANPPPSFEERVQRCKAMGLVVCLCSSHHLHDDPEAPLIMVHHADCEIHGKHHAA